MIKMAYEQQAFFKNNCFVFMQIGKEITVNLPNEDKLVSLATCTPDTICYLINPSKPTSHVVNLL